MLTKTNLIIYLVLILVALVLIIILAYVLDKYKRMKANAENSTVKSDEDVDYQEERVDKIMNAGSEPDKVLVPDNVKEKSSTESTQNVDAPEYDVKKERKK